MLTLDQLTETLDAYGVPEHTGDNELLGDVVSDPHDWGWAASTDAYVWATVKGWAIEEVTGGRHQYLMRQAVRIAAMRRRRCLAEADYATVVAVLSARMAELVTLEPVRKLAPGEVAEALAWGVAKAARKSDDDIEAELGHHSHGAADLVGTEVVADALSRLQKPPSRPVQADSPSDPLWDDRPVLRRVHDFARARMVAPLAVLGVAMARAVAAVPPGYVLPPTIGGHGTLNQFIALVGPSGGGKGAALAAGDDVLDLSGFRDALDGSPVLHTSDVGSGEGVVHQYARYEGKDGVRQYRQSVLFNVPEIDQATAVSSRQGSTLMAVLRKAYSGEALSFAYADPTKRLHLRAHAYRMALVAGVQPGRAAALLDDADGGTPQRFLWLPVTDPTMPRERPAQPKPWTVELPPPVVGQKEIAVCTEATGEITEAHWRRSRGEGDALDGHSLYTRLKVAAALAVLDGHLGSKGVTDEDWQLAGVLMAISDDTRAKVQAELRRTSAQANKARAEAEAVRDIVRADTVADAGVQKAGRAVLTALRKQAGEWRSTREIRAAVAGRVKPHLADALDVLVRAGSVDVEQFDHNGQPGWRYRVRS